MSKLTNGQIWFVAILLGILHFILHWIFPGIYPNSSFDVIIIYVSLGLVLGYVIYRKFLEDRFYG